MLGDGVRVLQEGEAEDGGVPNKTMNEMKGILTTHTMMGESSLNTNTSNSNIPCPYNTSPNIERVSSIRWPNFARNFRLLLFTLPFT